MSSHLVLSCLMVYVIASWLPAAHAYSSGAPVHNTSGLCNTMEPVHNVSASQTTPSPYQVVVDSTCYSDTARTITVYVNRVTNASEPYFEGFLLMARKKPNNVIDSTTNYGTFGTANDAELKTVDCYNKTSSSVTHHQSQQWDCKKMTFTIPTNEKETFYIHATVVRDFNRYWKNLISPAIIYSNATCPQSLEIKCSTGDINPTAAPGEITTARAPTGGATTTTRAPTGDANVINVTFGIMFMCFVAILVSFNTD